jgi:hypothetical protein
VEAQQLLNGRYRLEARIGQGGMSVVWRASDEVLRRHVAVKVLAGALATDPAARLRIQAEARAAARLAHPHVASVYDYGVSADADGEPEPFVVMELLRGPTLGKRLAGGPIPVPEALRICAEVASGIAAAHEEGLVHRDVKPSNVVLAPSGAKVVDFGIAAAAGPLEDLDESSRMVGTPAYLAPERVIGGDVMPASDVYAVGLLLHAVLTGRLPWRVETTTQMLKAHVYVQPEPMQPVPGVPRHVIELCEQCLAKEPTDRPSAAEVAAVLADAAGIPLPGAGVGSAPPPLPPDAGPGPGQQGDAGRRGVHRRDTGGGRDGAGPPGPGAVGGAGLGAGPGAGGVGAAGTGSDGGAGLGGVGGAGSGAADIGGPGAAGNQRGAARRGGNQRFPGGSGAGAGGPDAGSAGAAGGSGTGGSGGSGGSDGWPASGAGGPDQPGRVSGPGAGGPYGAAGDGPSGGSSGDSDTDERGSGLTTDERALRRAAGARADGAVGPDASGAARGAANERGMGAAGSGNQRPPGGSGRGGNRGKRWRFGAVAGVVIFLLVTVIAVITFADPAGNGHDAEAQTQISATAQGDASQDPGDTSGSPPKAPRPDTSPIPGTNGATRPGAGATAGNPPANGGGATSAPSSPPVGETKNPAPEQRTITSEGGNVVAECSGTLARIVSTDPADGYTVRKIDPGPATRVRVWFKAKNQVKVDIHCVGGVPTQG